MNNHIERSGNMWTIRLMTAAALAVLLLPSCSPRPDPSDSQGAPGQPSFAEDVAFLKQYGEILVLESKGVSGRVAVSPTYQGRVMTSAIGESAASLGWINRDFIAAGESGGAFNNYGGEDRFWLGPEAGQYGLFFPPDSGFTFSAWQVPAAMNQGAWEVEEQSAESVTLTRSMSLRNYAGARFDLAVSRQVETLASAEITSQLGAPLPESIEVVAYETRNRVENTGQSAWSTDEGLVSIWILGMYETFGTTYVVVPYEGNDPGAVLNTSYFGEIPAERLSARDGVAVFRCDGEYRSKIGVNQTGATPVMGSYSPEVGMLTLVFYDLPEEDMPYVNSLWEIQEAPFEGDVVNSYNDGSPGPGLPPLGGFYELETSSPGLELAPGETYEHRHTTLHMVGGETALAGVAKAVLGVSLNDILSRLEPI